MSAAPSRRAVLSLQRGRARAREGETTLRDADTVAAPPAPDQCCRLPVLRLVLATASATNARCDPFASLGL